MKAGGDEMATSFMLFCVVVSTACGIPNRKWPYDDESKHRHMPALRRGPFARLGRAYGRRTRGRAPPSGLRRLHPRRASLNTQMVLQLLARNNRKQGGRMKDEG